MGSTLKRPAIEGGADVHKETDAGGKHLLTFLQLSGTTRAPGKQAEREEETTRRKNGRPPPSLKKGRNPHPIAGRRPKKSRDCLQGTVEKKKKSASGYREKGKRKLLFILGETEKTYAVVNVKEGAPKEAILGGCRITGRMGKA